MGETPQEWAEKRKTDEMAIFLCESRDAVLTGETYSIRDYIKSFGGKWDGKAKAWNISRRGAIPETHAEVAKKHEFLDSLAGLGVQVSYSG
jgi:hypothetical protein